MGEKKKRKKKKRKKKKGRKKKEKKYCTDPESTNKHPLALSPGKSPCKSLMNW